MSLKAMVLKGKVKVKW